MTGYSNAGIVLSEPALAGFGRFEYLEMVSVADLLARVDMDPDDLGMPARSGQLRVKR
jgi:hypothetical protein